MAACKVDVGSTDNVNIPVNVPPLIGSFVLSTIVIFPVPSNASPFIVLGVCNLVAVVEFPETSPVTLPITLPVTFPK